MREFVELVKILFSKSGAWSNYCIFTLRAILFGFESFISKVKLTIYFNETHSMEQKSSLSTTYPRYLPYKTYLNTNLLDWIFFFN